MIGLFKNSFPQPLVCNTFFTFARLLFIVSSNFIINSESRPEIPLVDIGSALIMFFKSFYQDSLVKPT